MAAISAVAEDPVRIEDKFKIHELNEESVYAVELYPLGIPTVVTVDGFIPTGLYGGTKFAYAGDDNSLWVMVLEKAIAKTYGTYAAMIGGDSVMGVSLLTGTPSVRYYSNNSTSDELWEAILKHDAQNDMMTSGTACGCGSGDSVANSYGLACSHAYTIHGGFELSNGVRLVVVRNPWGTEGYAGPYSDTSSDWTEALKAEIPSYADALDGRFHMPIEDYMQSFRGIGANLDIQGMERVEFVVHDDENSDNVD